MQDHYTVQSDKTNKIQEDDIPIGMHNKSVIFLKRQEAKANEKGKTMRFKDYLLEPLVFTPKNMNYRSLIVGNSGCGKSTLASMLLKNYLKLYPDQQVFLFSIVDDDPAYEMHEDKINKVHINDDEIQDVTVDDLGNSICIFDDHALLDPKKQKILNLLKDNILRHGRHENIDSIVCLDKLLSGKDTLKEHLHSQQLCMFPLTGGNLGELEYFLHKKNRLTQKTIDKILSDSNSRWTIYNRTYPQYVISSDRVSLL